MAGNVVFGLIFRLSFLLALGVSTLLAPSDPDKRCELAPGVAGFVGVG